MNLRTHLTLLLASAVVTASLALAAEQGDAAAAKPAAPAKVAEPAAIHHDAALHHMHLSKDEITALQTALSKNGEYKGKIDGALGKETQTALRAYQKANALKVTGWPDNETLDKLGVAHAASPAMNVASHPRTTATASTKK